MSRLLRFTFSMAGENARAPFPRMKRCLLIYREDRESLCDPSYGYSNHPVLEEQQFPASTTDSEILAAARRREVKDLLEDRNTASEGRLNRVLLRVIQIAREIPI